MPKKAAAERGGNDQRGPASQAQPTAAQQGGKGGNHGKATSTAAKGGGKDQLGPASQAQSEPEGGSSPNPPLPESKEDYTRIVVDELKIEAAEDVVTLDLGYLHMYLKAVKDKWDDGIRKLEEFAITYEEFLMDIRKIVAKAGAVMRGIIFTYIHDKKYIRSNKSRPKKDEDSSAKYLIIRLLGDAFGVAVDTSILMEKENIYQVAYKNKKTNYIWEVLFDKETKKINLDVNRGGIPMSKKGTFNHGYTVELAFDDYVGSSTFYRALQSIERGEQEGFQSLCYMIAEVVRLGDVAKEVQLAILQGEERNINGLKDYMHSWKIYSHALVKNKYEEMKSGKKLCRLRGGSSIACGYQEHEKNLRKRMEIQLERMRKNKQKCVDICDIQRLEFKGELSLLIELVRDNMLRSWKVEGDSDVWDALKMGLEVDDDDIAKFIVYHNNLVYCLS